MYYNISSILRFLPLISHSAENISSQGKTGKTAQRQIGNGSCMWKRSQSPSRSGCTPSCLRFCPVAMPAPLLFCLAGTLEWLTETDRFCLFVPSSLLHRFIGLCLWLVNVSCRFPFIFLSVKWDFQFFQFFDMLNNSLFHISLHSWSLFVVPSLLAAHDSKMMMAGEM